MTDRHSVSNAAAILRDNIKTHIDSFQWATGLRVTEVSLHNFGFHNGRPVESDVGVKWESQHQHETNCDPIGSGCVSTCKASQPKPPKGHCECDVEIHPGYVNGRKESQPEVTSERDPKAWLNCHMLSCKPNGRCMYSESCNTITLVKNAKDKIRTLFMRSVPESRLVVDGKGLVDELDAALALLTKVAALEIAQMLKPTHVEQSKALCICHHRMSYHVSGGCTGLNCACRWQPDPKLSSQPKTLICGCKDICSCPPAGPHHVDIHGHESFNGVHIVEHCTKCRSLKHDGRIIALEATVLQLQSSLLDSRGATNYAVREIDKVSRKMNTIASALRNIIP